MPNRYIPAVVRFRSRYSVNEAGCWVWLGHIQPNGYGQLSMGGRSVYAHRAAVILHRGPIAAGMTVDHLCRVRSCVNPDHLEVVTQRTNLLRGETIPAKHAKKTRCASGHPLSGDNLVIDQGHRRCRECRRQRDRERYPSRPKRPASCGHHLGGSELTNRGTPRRKRFCATCRAARSRRHHAKPEEK